MFLMKQRRLLFILEVRMAIKVIEYGKRNVKCSYCGSKLQYEKEDVKTMQTDMNEWQSYIACPVCEEKIYVND